MQIRKILSEKVSGILQKPKCNFAAEYFFLQKCRCGNMCTRESGKRKRCSFRDLDRHCTNICNCGKKFSGKIVEICKNRMVRTNM